MSRLTLFVLVAALVFASGGIAAEPLQAVTSSDRSPGAVRPSLTRRVGIGVGGIRRGQRHHVRHECSLCRSCGQP